MTMPATSSQYTVGQDALTAVHQQYPTLAWMLTIPDLAPLIIGWAQSGADPTVVQAEFEASPWYQQHSDSARKWIAEMATDQAQSQSDLAAQESAIQATLAGLGLQPTADQVAMFANASLMNGWTQQQLKDQISQSIQTGPNGTFTITPIAGQQGQAGDYAAKLPNAAGAVMLGTVGANGQYSGSQISGGAPVYALMPDGTLQQGFNMASLAPGTQLFTLPEFAPFASGDAGTAANTPTPPATGVGVGASGVGALQSYQNQITAEAAKYMVPVAGSTVTQFAQAMVNGTMDVAAIDAYMQAQASSLYPSMAGAIAAGISPQAYMDPYRSVASNLLGIDANSIDMTQPMWMRPVLQKDPKTGMPTAMSLYEWQQTLMSDPTYNYMNSQNAQDRAASLAQGLGEMFGATPSGGSSWSGVAAPRV